MRNDMKINGQNGYDTYRVRMGNGFIDAIESGAPLKDPIENTSRLEHGVRMLVSRKIDKRAVTLTFNIHGSTKTGFLYNKRAFEAMLLRGLVDIQIIETDGTLRNEVYHLVYTGKSVTYNHSFNGKFGIWTASFIEPNPANRTATPNSYVTALE